MVFTATCRCCYLLSLLVHDLFFVEDLIMDSCSLPH